jgi:Putative Actinobacterial Holin-X, holin superfamily III
LGASTAPPIRGAPIVTATSQPNRPASAAAGSAAEPSLGKLVQDASESVSTIIRGEIALAKLELTASVKKGGLGAALCAVAGVLLFFSLTFGLIALAEGLITAGLYRWLGYLVVFAALLVVIAVLVVIGVKLMKRVKGPQQTIAAGKETVAYLKSHPKSVS